MRRSTEGTLAALLAGIERELPRAVELRHRLHAQPELARAEHATATAVAAELPVRARRVAGTGVVAIVGERDGGDAGNSANASGGGRGALPLVAVRAELDGLPIHERTGAAFSARGETMHACGHDVHMAALVALARAAHALDGELPARMALVLQPSEEAHPSGAREMVDGELASMGLDAIVAAHIHPELPWGSVALDAGAVNASCDTFEIVVEGEPTHGAYPHLGRDPILALAQAIVTLHAQIGRRIDPLHGASLSVGAIAGGSAENVIPARASARGALRALRADDRVTLRAMAEEVVTGVAAAHGCKGRIELATGEPALENDAAIVAAARPQLATVGLSAAAEWRSCGSDDFAFFGALAPIAMAFVGLDGAPGFASRPLHHPELLAPDEAVGAVARTLAALYTGASEAAQA